MAFPVAQATNSSQEATDTTSHTVSLPAGVADGDLLVVSFQIDGTPTVTWPGGWTVFIDQTTGTGGAKERLNVAYRRADGTEGASITITSSVSQESTHAAYRITGHHASTDPEGSSTFGGSDANPDPPSHTASWGAEDNLWIAIYGWDKGNITNVSYPANYTGSQLTEASGGGRGVGIASATRDLNAATEDPGTGTISASETWNAATVAIRPATGETPVSQTAESDYEGLEGLSPSKQKAFESLISVRREL